MKVRVVEYRGRLVIEASEPDEPADYWVPFGEGRIGCVIIGTKDHLGISPQALDILRRIPRNRDAIGDVSWWRCDDGTHVFAWFGEVRRILHPSDAEAARDTVIFDDAFTPIGNEASAGAKAAVDAEEATAERRYTWTKTN